MPRAIDAAFGMGIAERVLAAAQPVWADLAVRDIATLAISLLALGVALVAIVLAFKQVRLATRQAALLDEQLDTTRRQVTLAEQHAGSSRKQLALAELQTTMAERQQGIAKDLRSMADSQVQLAESQHRRMLLEAERRPTLSLNVRYFGQDDTEVVWLLCLLNRGQQLAHGVHWHIFVPVEYPYLEVYVDGGATRIEPGEMASMNFAGVHHQYSHFFERPLFPQHAEVCATLRLRRPDQASRDDHDISLSWLLFSESGTFPLEGEPGYLVLQQARKTGATEPTEADPVEDNAVEE